jgi:predicted CXXCH cytochrome family protein
LIKLALGFILMTRASGWEVGSQACAPCHPAIVKSYGATAMAQSSGLLNAPKPWESLERAEVGRVRVSADAGRIYFAIADGETHVRRPLDYFIGSGLVGRSYASAIDGFLFQAPVSYYTSQRRWDISPGFEKSDELSLTRAVEPACLRCHSSRLQPLEGTVNGYATPAFLEGGVSCERCHGAGEAHVAGKKAAIVNPAKLDPLRRDSICAQCHLSGVTEIAKKGASPYVPGGLLTDSSIVFVWSRGGTLNANSHFERMAQSACWQASERKLWCGTCHDAHSRPSQATKVSFYRARCLTCHTDKSCSEKGAVRMAAKNNCIQCHMPRTDMATVRHAAATDHSIPRSPKPNSPTSNGGAVLVPFEGSATDRERGLAYADVALKDNNRQWGMRAFELLRKQYEADSSDEKVATQLAQLYDRMGNEPKACEIYAALVSRNPNAIAPAVNLGACMAKRGQIDESIRLWTGVLKRSPGLESARMNLVVALKATGDEATARQVIRDGRKINPLSQVLPQSSN